MAISDNYVPLKQLGNGVTTQFSANWNMLSASYAQVYLESVSTGVQTLLTQGAGANQYTIALTSTGFTATLNTAPTSANYVVILRSVDVDQTTPYKTSKGFQGAVEEDSFDKLTAICQDQASAFTRALTVPYGETGTNLILPAALSRASKFVSFDATGNVIAATGVSSVPVTNYWTGVLSGSSNNYEYAVSSGVNDQSVTCAPAIPSLSAGTKVNVKAGSSNTGAMTLNVNELGAVAVRISSPTGLAACTGGEIVTGQMYSFIYDSTYWICLNPSVGTPNQFSGFVNLVRNGSLMIWQRPIASVSVPSGSGQYVADGLVIVPTGAAVTVDRAAGNGRTLYSCQVTGAASVTDLRAYFRIESHVAAKAVSSTLLFQAYIRNDTGGTITPTLNVLRCNSQDNWGATTSELATVNLQPCANGAWTKVAYAFTTSASVGFGLQFLLGFGNNFSSNGKSMKITEIDCRVVSGYSAGLVTSPPASEIRDPSTELVWCQRHFQSIKATSGSNTEIGTGYCYDTTIAVFVFRLSPSFSSQANAIAISNLAHFGVGIAGSVIAATSINITNANQDFVSINVNVAAGLTAGASCGLYMTNASGYIQFLGGEI